MEEREFRDWLSSYTDSELCMANFRDQREFFRLNTIKIDQKNFEERSNLKREKSPYYDSAFELKERRGFQIGKSWEYFLGLIYPQSMPSIATSLALDPGSEDTVLDVAASPGSKFSHMAMLMRNKGVLVGNDLKPEKLSALYATINRMNIINCIVTMRDGARLDWRQRFTKILLDAPCTALGSGMTAFERWDVEHSTRISNLQKRMLFSAYDALKPGGVIVYSTCTYAKEENEEVVKNLLENANGSRLEETGLNVPHDRGLSEYGDEFKKCVRIYPQHLKSEGFFISKIRKGE